MEERDEESISLGYKEFPFIWQKYRRGSIRAEGRLTLSSQTGTDERQITSYKENLVRSMYSQLRYPRLGPATKAIYVVFLHLLIAVMAVKSDFIEKVEGKLGTVPQELTSDYYRMLAYHKRMDALIPNGATIFIGDSITQGLATSAVSTLSVNYGIGSDTTLGVLRRLPHYNSVKTAEAVVFAVGVNDLKRREDTEIIDNFRAILQNVASQTKVSVSSVLPISNSISLGSFSNSRISNLNSSLADLTSDYSNAVFVDTGYRLKDENGSLQAEFHVGDGVHLNRKGYRVWISALKEGLSNVKDRHALDHSSF